MYVVTVTFEIHPDHIDGFRSLILMQATNSLEKEAACRQFDVCFAADTPNLCFLYEKYDNRAAFETHLASDHFQEFDGAVKPWVSDKQVSTWVEET